MAKIDLRNSVIKCAQSAKKGSIEVKTRRVSKIKIGGMELNTS